MRDFVTFCVENQLIDVDANGLVTWKEAAVKGGHSTKHQEKLGGGRDQRKDLSGDYKDYCHQMGTVWPFSIVPKKGSGKAVAPVGK